MENTKSERLKKSIEQYVDGKLSAMEIDELWSFIIQDKYLYDYLKTAVNLKLLIQDNMDITNNKSNYTVEFIEYKSGTIFYKTILKKSGEKLSVLFFETPYQLIRKKTKCNVFAQIIDGETEIIVDDNTYVLKLGQGIMIPRFNYFKIKSKNDREFKMILTQLISRDSHNSNAIAS
ncbi:MAG: hypothetical protein ACFCU6_09215 [Balneolaceae bacterium]